MKKIFLRLTIFSLPVILSILIIEIRLSSAPTEEYLKKAYFERNLDSIEILVLGSSHAFYGIDPSYFSMRGFNIAFLSQSLFYDSRIVLNYLKRMPKLKAVIITVSYHSLEYQVCDGFGYFHDFPYYQYWGFRYPEILWYDPRNYSKLLNFYSEGYRVRKMLFKNVIANYSNESRYGYRFNSPVVETADLSEKLVSEQVHVLDYFCLHSRIDENIHYLITMIEALKGARVKPILITIPVTSVFDKFANQQRNRFRIAICNSLARTYQVDYLNYYSDSRFGDEDFYDCDHLNYDGAKKFSKILNDTIMSSIIK